MTTVYGTGTPNVVVYGADMDIIPTTPADTTSAIKITTTTISPLDVVNELTTMLKNERERNIILEKQLSDLQKKYERLLKRRK